MTGKFTQTTEEPLKQAGGVIATKKEKRRVPTRQKHRPKAAGVLPIRCTKTK